MTGLVRGLCASGRGRQECIDQRGRQRLGRSAGRGSLGGRRKGWGPVGLPGPCERARPSTPCSKSWVTVDRTVGKEAQLYQEIANERKQRDLDIGAEVPGEQVLPSLLLGHGAWVEAAGGRR